MSLGKVGVVLIGQEVQQDQVTSLVGHAGVVFYTDLATFQANSTTAVAVTFEGFAPADEPIFSPITLGGVTFTPISSAPRPPNLFVRTPDGGQGNFAVPPDSIVLAARGNEHFDLTFAADPFAVGFDTYTNTFSPPVVSVYDTGGILLAAHVLTQAPGTLGFLGMVSDTPIGRVEWLATSGNAQDTAIDNVRIDVAVVHESGSIALLLAGLTIPAALRCRRREA
jgi:hypothetical protein